MVGVVSNVVSSKKFGFISGENGQEYFFHMTDMMSDWSTLVLDFYRIGGGKIKVEFEALKTPKGPRAKNVKIVGEV